MNTSAVISPYPIRTSNGKIIYTIESRKSLELDFADLIFDGKMEIFPHVEEKGLLYLQFRRHRLILWAGPYIGLIPLTPHISIDVRPKLAVSNLAQVLDTARRSLRSISGVDRLYLASQQSSSSVLEFLAHNLLDSTTSIITNGLHKEYVRRSTITSHPRGRNEVAGTLRLWSRGQFHRVQAQTFEQSSDISVNRLIKAAVRFVLQRVELESDASRELIRRANRMYYELTDSIGNMQFADLGVCKAIIRDGILPGARSYYYRALEIALLILSNHGVALQAHGNDVLLETFILNFEELFEDYVRRVLQNHADDKISVRNGNIEGKKPLFDDKLDPPAQPDIILEGLSTRHKVIIEIKYKDKPDRADINQTITYALSYGTSRAVLVHQRKPSAPRGLNKIGIIRGIEIDAYAFDLAAENLEVEELAFVQSLFALVRQSHVVPVTTLS